MKVLHINCNYMTTALHQIMIEHLDNIGVENHVFAPTYNKEMAVIKPRTNVTISECFKKWDRLWFDYKQKKIYNAVERSICVEKFDCIHAYTLFTDGNCAMKLSKKYNKPFVVAVRDTDVNAFFKLMPHLRGRGINIMKSASKIFFLSTTYRDFVIDKYVPERLKAEIIQKSQIIPNGIDDFWFANEYVGRDCNSVKHRFEHKQIKLIFAGRINKNKNAITTLKAIDILEQNGYKVDFIVAGGFEDDTIKQKLLSDNRVNYVGKLTKEELIKHYRQSDIFVMPSYHETFGLVYAEAMSQGLPVLYTKGQGFDGQFSEGAVGYSINPNSAEDIATKIIFVTQNYEAINSNCIDKYKKFSWHSIVSKYCTIYDEIT